MYDIQAISQIFYPNEKFTRVSDIQPAGVTIITELAAGECRAILIIDGRQVERQSLFSREYSNEYNIEQPLVQSKRASALPVLENDEENDDRKRPREMLSAGEGEYSLPGADSEHSTRRGLMIALYIALNKYTGLNPPWGALTGIRPSKMARLMLDNGVDRAIIVRNLSANYFTRPEKSELAINVANAEQKLIAAQPKDAVSLYVGIPFCPSRCLYCSFASYPVSPKTWEYVESLIKELDAVGELIKSNPISSLYIGGGTPTSLPDDQFERLLSYLSARFKASEFCVEAGRPDTVSRSKLLIMKRYGVNRITLNPQTMNDATLALIEREHGAEDITRAFCGARECGFDNINADIILGLPGETVAHVERTFDSLIKLDPENITVHILTIKRASRLRPTLNEYHIASVGELERMLDLSRQICMSTGYMPYYMYRQKNMLGNFENVGYSKPGREGIYNVMMMEETQSVWATGAGAVTKLVVGDKISRVFNVKSLDDYIKRVDEMIGRKRIAYANAARH
ncbi:MAG: coproporphyrinogen dehydrogenase HemZ [Clostridiales bacterium]|nr:coproporphyrinogen dehydrogenase HemZ [Clostridiales bacterium]